MSSDLDYELACLLQAELNEEGEQENRKMCRTTSTHTESKGSPRGSGKPLSIVDEKWEMLDPTPDVRAMFIEFDNTFFKGGLAGVEVKWSPRMTLCAGICSYEGRGGLCSIRLSTPLLKLRPRKDLVETLLHEMIHAYLFVTQNNRDRDGHGPEFCKHMNRINSATGTNISIYHNFQDEVDLYRQHIWRCDGPCRTRKPYFGYVKRSMNRAPSPLDTWWAHHQQTCGGTYHKEKEPEGYGEKKGKRKRDEVDAKESKKAKGQDTATLEGGNVLRSTDHKVHPTLVEIWSKKTRPEDITDRTISKVSNENSVAKNPIHNGRNCVSEGESNIHGFSGKVAAPTFHNFFKNPTAPSASNGRYTSDSGQSKENMFSDNDSTIMSGNTENRFPGRGKILGGSSKTNIDGIEKWFKGQNKPVIKEVGSLSDSGKPSTSIGQSASRWLSKESKDTKNSDKNRKYMKSDKHIKRSKKIVKLMEIVGSDSDSDFEENASVESNAKAIDVQYIERDEEEAYNRKIFAQMEANKSKHTEINVKINDKDQNRHLYGAPQKERSGIQDDSMLSRDSKEIVDRNQERKTKNIKINNNDAVLGGSMVKCPICGANVLETSINRHLDECLNQRFLNL